MKIDSETESIGSCIGVVMSTILGLIMGMFVYTKCIVWLKGKDVDVASSFIENAIDSDQHFTWEDGFFVAAALTEYSSNTEIIEEAKYGELFFEHYGWGNEGSAPNGSTPLDFHYCTDEDFGIVPGPDTIMYPVVEPS